MDGVTLEAAEPETTSLRAASSSCFLFAAGGTDIDFQGLRSAKLSGVRMGGRRDRSTVFGLDSQNTLAETISNKSLSFCEDADA